MYRNSVFIGMFCFFIGYSFQLSAQKANPWKMVDQTEVASTRKVSSALPQTYQAVELQVTLLEKIVTQAPLAHQLSSSEKGERLSLPMPDGTFQDFYIVDAPILHPDLAARYPSIHAYKGQGIDDPSAQLRLSWTKKGMHAIILSAQSGTVYIHPHPAADKRFHISFYKKDTQKEPFQCHVEEQLKSKKIRPTPNKANQGERYTYRLALACTGEYAQFHGGTKAAALAAMHATMTRVNGIFEQEVGLSMTLVADNDDLIFLDGSSDPYTNNDGTQMLSENQNTCDAIIGTAHYDIGHVFSTGGGGIASLHSPCSTGKARGVTGLATPVSDIFDVDYVAHEMGHQFGATHTFNNFCFGNRFNATAVEPGSASTIMSYAGICPPNVQSHSDAYFHSVSILQIRAFISNSACAMVSNSGNKSPSVSAGTNYVIPKGTPFELTASASDPDDDILTYCWEQIDTEIEEMPPVSSSDGGPLFRSYPPSISSSRVFPKMETIISNSSDEWEVLPTVGRSLNFNCTVRDNHLAGGCTHHDNTQLTVASNAGPFLVTAPNHNTTWIVNSNQTVTWEVANTNIAPINCTNVRILLSTDGGYSYPHILLDNAPNTGSAIVTVPDLIGTNNRIRIEGKNNVFFDISNTDFVIEAASVSSFWMSAMPQSQYVCKNIGSVIYNIDLTPVLDFDEEVNLSVSNVPLGASAYFNPASVSLSSNQQVQLVVANLQNVALGGSYELMITATSNSISIESSVELKVFTGTAAPPTLLYPYNSNTNTDPIGPLNWKKNSHAEDYIIQIASSPSFENSIIESATTLDTFYTPANLNTATVYYWRVKSSNPCGIGNYGVAYAFQTHSINCSTYELENGQENLPLEGSSNVTFNLTEPTGLLDLNVRLEIEHPWVGDLSATITSPQGTTVKLFNRPGSSESQYGCGEDNLLLTFDDDAPNSATDFENTCLQNQAYAIEGSFQAKESLSTFKNEPIQGEWIVQIDDNFTEQDEGHLIHLALDICNPNTSIIPPVLLENEPLLVKENEQKSITSNFLNTESLGATDDAIQYMLRTVPQNGDLLLNGNLLQIGDSFSQKNINNIALSYQHDGSPSLLDGFIFDVIDNQGGWLPSTIFTISIVKNTLITQLFLEETIDCHNANNGVLRVEATSDFPPYQYRLNNGAFQTDLLFENIAAGTYTVLVRDNLGFELATNLVSLTNPAPLTLELLVNENNITAIASGGTGSLTYNLNQGIFQESPLFMAVENGQHTIIVSDQSGCTTTSTAFVEVNTLQAQLEITKEVSCHSGLDGTIQALAIDGTPPYIYSINNGTNYQSSFIFDNLGSGTYSVLIKDAEGFTRNTNTVFVNEAPEIIAFAAADYDDLVITAQGGTGILSYSLDGVNFQLDPRFTDLANGTYDVFLRDEKGCMITLTGIIMVNNLTVQAHLFQAISCHNNNDGSIFVNVSGGTPPFQYRIVGQPNYQNHPNFKNLSAGSYTIQVLDAISHTATSDALVLQAPAPLVLSATTDNYKITLSANGGTPPYQYSLDNQSFQNDAIFNDLNNGQYTVFVKDSQDCVTNTTTLIAVNSLEVALTILQETSCYNAQNGSVQVLVEGGTPPYQYSLNGADFQNSPVFKNLLPSAYSCMVKDSDGFSKMSNPVNLINPEPISATITIDENTITVEASGGTGNLSYSLDNKFYQSSPIFGNLPNDSYTVYIRDANGCIEIRETTITINTLSITANLLQPVSCYNAMDARLETLVEGGTAPYHYSLDGVLFQDSPIFEQLAAGTYQILVRDAQKFVQTSNLIIIENPIPLSANITVNENTIIVHTNGGAGALSYSLDNQTFQSAPFFDNLANGTYTIFVKDQNECSTTVDAIISINSLVVLAQLNQTMTCSDDNNAIINVIVNGGTPPYSYSLDGINFQNQAAFYDLEAAIYQILVRDAEGFEYYTNTIEVVNPPPIMVTTEVIDNFVYVYANGGVGTLSYSLDNQSYQTEALFKNLANGAYTVFVKDENNCIITRVATIAMNTIVASTQVQQVISCYNAQNGAIKTFVSGGKPPYLYSLEGQNFQVSPIFDALKAGAYHVLVRDAEGFSLTTSPIVLNNPPLMVLSKQIKGNTATINATGGTGVYTYSLDNINFKEENIFMALPNGTHSVYVKDSNGCKAFIVLDIAMNTLAIATIITDNTSCATTQDGSLQVYATGGMPPYQYSIDGINYQNSAVFDNLAAGTYQSTVLDNEGFTLQTNLIAIESPLPIIATTGVVEDQISVSASGGTGSLRYSIDGINFQNSPIFLDLANGTYTVVVADENDCTTMIMATVAVVPPLEMLSVDVEPIRCFGTSDGSIAIYMNGGIPPYQYSMNSTNFQSENIFYDLGVGTYTITVKDTEGRNFTTTSILMDNPLKIEFSVSIFQNNITVLAHGGTGNLRYSIDSGETFQANNEFSNLDNGTYVVGIIDENNCLAFVPIIIDHDPTSSHSLFTDLEFTIYPNPTNGMFTVVLENTWEQEVQLSLFNSIGQAVLEHHYHSLNGNFKASIHADELPTGLYQLRVVNGAHFGVKQVFIVK